MGGAFVGVADDGSAAYWNPSGVGLSPPGHFSFEYNRFETGDQNAVLAPGPTRRTSGFATFGSRNISVSYANVQTADLFSVPQSGTFAETLKTTEYGVTVLQGLSKNVIIGSTLKLIHGYSAVGPANGTNASDALSNAFNLQGNGVNRFDFDIGVIADFKIVRLGLSTKNLQEPSFPNPAGPAITLKRQARIGLSVLPFSGLTLATDVDLDTVDLRGGQRRMIALGGEQRLGKRFALRGGMRWSIAGDRQLVGTAGVSWALSPKAWLDGHYTQGELDGDRGFGIALRAGS